MPSFVRYGDGVKGFRIYSPLEGRVILSGDVTFDESTLYSNKSTEPFDLGKKGAGRTCYRQIGCMRYISHPLLIYLKYSLLMMMLRFQCRVLLNLRLFQLLLTLGRRWNSLIRGHLVNLTPFLSDLDDLS